MSGLSLVPDRDLPTKEMLGLAIHVPVPKTAVVTRAATGVAVGAAEALKPVGERQTIYVGCMLCDWHDLFEGTEALQGVARLADHLADLHPEPLSRSSYGWDVGPSEYGPRGIIGHPERSAAGNVVLRAGDENIDGSWSQSVHVVLTPDEACSLVAVISKEAQA